ncbi:hypothetical protein OG897_37555 [Streptomyces sp. NBC_00237]|uniref:hypothetical protein n=1 Tax=Streptomyces sp. NBC_00237 TaxID=2975687 RepID=UPI0022590BA4|nr:hypothetical protein [Streptomyces sp. NBC_00237]MCX5207099.1 hypothetical protein [Streptomyces sp. NBC_00237]
MTLTPAEAPLASADVRRATDLCIAALRPARDADWSVPAGELEWDCWETAEHLVDDLFAYASRLAVERIGSNLPHRRTPESPGAPRNAVRADRAAGVEGLLAVLDSAAGLMCAVASVKSPEARAYHVYGDSDPEGFAAMSIVELFVHTHDLTTGLGLDAWEPPADLCARTLHRLFPHVPADTAPWPTLLWATGRGELPGRARLDEWRWYGAPR